jgi:hypothetical protein
MLDFNLLEIASEAASSAGRTIREPDDSFPTLAAALREWMLILALAPSAAAFVKILGIVIAPCYVHDETSYMDGENRQNIPIGKEGCMNCAKGGVFCPDGNPEL